MKRPPTEAEDVTERQELRGKEERFSIVEEELEMVEDSTMTEVVGSEDVTERKELRGREEFCDIRRMVKFGEEQEVEEVTQ